MTIKTLTLSFLVLGMMVKVASPQAPRPLAPSREVFGIHLGEDFTIPECQQSIVGVERLCFRRYSWVRGPLQGEIPIYFPENASPEMAAGPVLALVVEGKTEGMRFYTLGARSADRNLSVLTSKYGKPSADPIREPVQTALGVKFDRIFAGWFFKDLTVILDSGSKKVNQGEITIDTPLGREWRDRQAEETRSRKTPL
jgi:hypothetical protein